MKLIKNSDRFFIAGGTGMAGMAIRSSLHKNGYHNQLTPSRKELDLLNGAEVEEWMKTNKPDVVVIAAAKVGGIKANNSQPADFILENLKIETNVIESAFRCGVSRLLFLGSSCIYPKFAQQPIREEELLRGELEPTNQWYAIAKIAGIKLCQALRKQYGFDAISLMPTNLYGKGDNYNAENSHVLPALINRFHEAKQSGAAYVKCWGSGNPLREFLHADDLGEACVFALENWNPDAKDAAKDTNGEALAFLNVGTGTDISICDLAEKIAHTTSFDGAIKWDSSKPDGTPKKLLEVSRLKNLGWSSKIQLDEGLCLTYKDYLERVETGSLRR